MSETTAVVEPKLKRKAFAYRTRLHWVGGRAGVLEATGKPSFRVASPPEFKGEPNVWTPEDLFVAAVNVCTMTTFLAFAQRLDLPIDSYASEAEGTLEFGDGGYRFTRVRLRPVIRVADADAVGRVERTLSDAHASCFVSNSVRASVVIEPTVEWSGAAPA